MESPTIEISRSLEALRLAGQLDGLPRHGASSSSTVRTLQERRKDPSVLVPSSDTDSNHVEVEDRLRRSLQPKPTHNVHDSSNCCPHHLQAEQQHPPFMCLSPPTCSYCMERESLHHRPSVLQNHTPSTPTHKDCTKHGCGNSVCIIDSFNTLSVSSAPAAGLSGSLPHSTALLRSCREEAAAAANRNYLDDTTVDDLAGYLDEIMFIPKPMSEMAELMYT